MIFVKDCQKKILRESLGKFEHNCF